MDYGIFVTHTETGSSTLIGNMNKCHLNVVLPHWYIWQTDNTLRYASGVSSTFINNFRNNITGSIPGAKIYAWASSVNGGDEPDISTAAKRSACAGEMIEWAALNTVDGILDDMEGWVGTDQNHYDYYTQCAATFKTGSSVKYMPWAYWSWVGNNITADYPAIGMYDLLPYSGSQWGTRIDTIQANSSGTVGYGIYVIHGTNASTTANDPDLQHQLELFQTAIDSHGGISYYSKLELVGMYWDYELTDADYDAFQIWVEQYTGSGGTGSALGDLSVYFEGSKMWNDPSTSGWGYNEAGRIWYNRTTDTIKYWNGSAVKTCSTD